MNLMKLILIFAIIHNTLGLIIKHSKGNKYDHIMKNDLKLLDAQQLREYQDIKQVKVLESTTKSIMNDVILKDITKENEIKLSLYWHQSQLKKHLQIKEKMMANMWKEMSKSKKDLNMQRMKFNYFELQAEELAIRNKRMNAENAYKNELIASINFKLKKAQQIALNKEKIMAFIWKEKVATKKNMIKLKMLQSFEPHLKVSNINIKEESRLKAEEESSTSFLQKIGRKFTSFLNDIMKNTNKFNYALAFLITLIPVTYYYSNH
jgi:hypothetical protein